MLDSSSKSIRARAQNNLWEVVHKKAEVTLVNSTIDLNVFYLKYFQKSTNNVEEMKLKIKTSMKNGFMPL